MQKRMSDSKAEKLQAVAVMKYKLGMTNAEIAKRMKVSAMTISRFLDMALEAGIVTISVKTNIVEDEVIENKLKENYSLRDVVVVTGDIDNDPLEATTIAAARHLDMILTENDVFGVVAGHTIGMMMPHMRLSSISDTSKFTIVQLQGGSYSAGMDNASSIISNFVNRFGAKGFLMQHPLYAKTEELFRIAKKLDWNTYIKQWQSCSVIAIGLGIVTPSIFESDDHMLAKEDYNEIVAKKAVGRVFGLWIDEDGTPIDCSSNRRVFSIPLDVASKIPLRMGISSGVEKIDVIKAAIKSGIINALVIDAKTARYLI